MPNQIESLHVKGFRSLADVEINEMPRAAVLIGANGSGKSNLVRFFEMMNWMIGARRLDEFIQRRGGADDQLFGGTKTSPRMEAELAIRTEFGRNDYRFALSHAHPDRFMFMDEAFRFTRDGLGSDAPWQPIGSGHTEAKIVNAAQSVASVDIDKEMAGVLVHLLLRCVVYQFHDTSYDSSLKKKWESEDNIDLRSDGGNLAAVLLRLEQMNFDRFEAICDSIRRVLPIFDRFWIKEEYGKVLLRWKAKGMDKTIGAHLTSDGSLRLFALATLLNLPPEMLPDVLILDGPELGLHPDAVALVGDMIKVLAEDRQVIVATQSPLLVDQFALDEILVLELRDRRTEIHRYKEIEYRDWLEEYTTGELWQKNVIGGCP